MILSRDRILTTHVGSLPRNEGLSELLVQREAGEAYDKVLFGAEMEKAIRHVVAKQKAAGIDSGNDGEQQRVRFQTYIPQRMSGFGGESKRRRGREFASRMRRRRRAKFTITIRRPSSARLRSTSASPAKASRLRSRS